MGFRNVCAFGSGAKCHDVSLFFRVALAPRGTSDQSSLRIAAATGFEITA